MAKVKPAIPPPTTRIEIPVSCSRFISDIDCPGSQTFEAKLAVEPEYLLVSNVYFVSAFGILL
jgi:hypothetical protein